MRSDADAKERIRRSCHIDEKSMCRIAQEESYSRPIIEKAITNQLHNPYRVTRPKAAPIFGSYQGRVDALLHGNEHLSCKQRYTVHRMFEVIQAEGYQGRESRIHQYVSARHAVTRTPEVFLPLEFEPGQVRFTRRNFLLPLPTATSFEDFNWQVLQLCLQSKHSHRNWWKRSPWISLPAPI